jgi:tetratricopeptide (TPR) repeat protein
MRGLVTQLKFNPASNKEAIALYERALTLDPRLVRAQGGLAGALSDRVIFGWSANPRADAERAEKLADEAISAEPGNADAHLVKALVVSSLIMSGVRTPKEQQWRAAISEAEAARDINPNLALAHDRASFWRLFLGRAADGISGVETAMKLSPRDPARPFWEYDICHLHSHLGQWEQALDHCRLAAQGVPFVWYPYADLIAANAWLGRDAEAKAALADLLKLKPDMTAQAFAAAAATYSDNPVFTQEIARMVEGLRKGGLPEGMAKTN